MKLEIGPLRITLEPGEEPAAVLSSLLRRLSNKELSHAIGVSDKTVQRWKMEGRLPTRTGGHVLLVDLLAAGPSLTTSGGAHAAGALVSRP